MSLNKGSGRSLSLNSYDRFYFVQRSRGGWWALSVRRRNSPPVPWADLSFSTGTFLQKHNGCFLPGTDKLSRKLLWPSSFWLVDSTIPPNFSELSALLVGRAALPVFKIHVLTLAPSLIRRLKPRHDSWLTSFMHHFFLSNRQSTRMSWTSKSL